MTTTPPAETPAQEYARLAREMTDIEAIARRSDEVTPETRRRYTAITARMREIRAVPPDGYTLPPAAAGLIAHAAEHGWQTSVQWTPPGWDGKPYVKVQVGRRTGPEEWDVYLYELTWHSRGCAPGRVRLFSSLARTPDRPETHDGPSVRAIRALITTHPVPPAT